jgi:hypothetical protein
VLNSDNHCWTEIFEHFFACYSALILSLNMDTSYDNALKAVMVTATVNFLIFRMRVRSLPPGPLDMMAINHSTAQ